MNIFNPSPGPEIPRVRPWLPLLLLGILAQPLSGQSARLRVEENIRAEPGGQIIGQLQAGASLRTGRRQGDWIQATFQGWMWARSLQVRTGGAFDLRVMAPGGENLRDAAQGEVVGRMIEGALFQEMDRVPGWIQVQRTAWIWVPSLEMGAPADPESGSTAAARPASPRTAASGEVEWLRTDEAAVTFLASPDGDTLGTTAPGTDLRVLSREGNWARVRLEGWVWEPDFERGPTEEGPFLTSVTPEMMVEDPEAYEGQTVSWEVQFISAERAEQIRTDFYEGEPFILARYGGDAGTFVYIAFPPDRLGEVTSLTPLERISVVGRVRTGRTALTGNPILDLLELRRLGRE